MGRTVPLGYDAAKRKLVVNEGEAATVRAIFNAFVRLGSVQETLRWAKRQQLRTKVRQRAGQQVGGTPFHYGALRCVLGNRTYVGEVEHKGTTYPGKHEAIVDRELFDRAQAILASRSTEEMRRPKLASPSLLQGLIFDRHERKMGPAHTRRNGQRFRYYVTHAKQIGVVGPAAYRVSAEPIESHCLSILAEHLTGNARSLEQAEAAASLARSLWAQPQLVSEHIAKVIIGDAELTIELRDGAVLQRSLNRIRHGNDAKLVIGNNSNADNTGGNQQLITLMQDAARAQALALARPKLSIDELAAKFGRSTERFKRLIRLSYLSPMIVTAILKGQQRPQLTSRSLQHLDGLPLTWAEQEAMLLS
jgi:hypothetical protein